MDSRTTVSSVRHCPIQCLYRKTISDKYFCVVRLLENPVSVGGIPVTVTRESHPRPRLSHFQERCMMTRIKSCTGDTSTKITNCAGGRHNMPPPLQKGCKLTFDLLSLKVVSESRVTWATSVPILVFLGLSLLDLGPMYATDRGQTDIRQTDVRHASSLNASALWGRGITI